MRSSIIPAFSALLLCAAFVAGPRAATTLEQAEQQIPGSDLWIEGQLETIYALNEHLNPFGIEVESESGQVTLGGSVPSETQRRLAEQLARDIAEIRSVENNIAVHPDAALPAPKALYAVVSDANITTRIELRLLWNRETSSLDIDVDTADGEVRLGGTAASEAERQAAERIALGTEGVRAVENSITVAEGGGTGEASSDTDAAASPLPSMPVGDAWITARVEMSLRFDSEIKDGNIDVSTDNGVVSLTGTVRSQAQKEKAAEVAGGIIGVKQVDNALRIAQAS
ncbi:MAG: BON domain-containing protein [Thiohalocapsa sp.]|nr:BON domain-containing protein [Thiohalocapsa sp.]